MSKNFTEELESILHLNGCQSADSSGSHKLPKGGWSRPVSAPKSQARTRPGGQPSPSEHSYE